MLVYWYDCIVINVSILDDIQLVKSNTELTTNCLKKPSGLEADFTRPIFIIRKRSD
jgi:hypothetical protein